MTQSADHERDAVARLEELGRVVRARSESVEGAVVLRHAATGIAFAAVCSGNELVVRLDARPKIAIATHATLPDGWMAIDPWPQDALFQRGDDLVRDAIRRAHRAAGSD